MSEVMDACSQMLQAEARAPTAEQINRLQGAMVPIQCAMPEAVHHYAAGMYAREFSMPAGMAVVGKKHRHEHFMFVIKGHARVASEFGTQEVKAGFIAVSPPGAKRVVYAIEDTTFVTVHLNPTDTKDLYVIEAAHIEPESEEFQALMREHRKELK